jgi:uncharacterized protein YraI
VAGGASGVGAADTASAVVIPGGLNLRGGPGTAYASLAVYPKDTTVRVTGKNAAATWLQVRTPDGRTGWMDRACLRVDGALDRIPVVAVGAPAAVPPAAVVAPSAPALRPAAPAPPPAPVVAAPGSQAPANSGVNTASSDVPNITDAPKGLGVVIVDTTDLHVAPGARTEVVQALRHDQQVRLFGQAKGAWVRVQPFDSVVPGWVYAADLRPLPGAISGGPAITDTLALSGTATLTPTLALTPTPVAGAASPTLTAAPTALVATAEVEPDAAVDATATAGPERAPVEISVDVVEAAAAPTPRPGQVAPTPAKQTGVPGVRVQIVTVFGEVLLEAVTPANGQVTFTRDIAPDTALYAQLPALGLRTQVPADEVAAGKSQVTIAVPPLAR